MDWTELLRRADKAGRKAARCAASCLESAAIFVQRFGRKAAKASSKVDVESYLEMLNVYKRVNKRGVGGWLDRISFKDILALWLFITASFGFMYFFFGGADSYLYSMREGRTVQSVEDCIYFSFVAATTTGFGDIVPYGMFKIVAIFEVVSGLLLLALVTSKLVSIKQDAILDELYELSFSEKVNKKRSTLLLFNQNVDMVIMKIEEGSIRKRELNNLYIHFTALEDALNETLALVKKPKGRRFVKKIDPVNTELILNSIVGGLDKVAELLLLMTQHRMEWRSPTNLSIMKRCLNLTDSLFSNLRSSDVRPEALSNLDERRKTLSSRIKSEMERTGSWVYPER